MHRVTQLNVLLTTLGSAGDVNPFLAIGRALLQRGHRVTLITSTHFQEVAGEAGLAFVGVGTREDYAQVIDDPDLWDPNRGFRVFVRRVIVPAIRPTYDILTAHLQPNTVIVAQGQAFAGHLVHEKYDVPFATVQLQPIAFRSIYDAPVIPKWIPIFARSTLFKLIDFMILDREVANPINVFRSELGLAPVRHIFGSWAHSPQKTIGLFPDWFAAPQVDWPTNAKLSGFILMHQEPATLDSELGRFLDSGPPPVIFAPGTEVKRAEEFFATSIRAVDQLGRRAILLSRHTRQLPSLLPEGVVAFPHIPFPTVLPRAAAIVHHGGIGTVAHAFAAGIPQIIRPMAHDQPDNAARVERLGVGTTIHPKEFTARRLQSALQALLSSDSVSETCRRYSGKVASDTALAIACDEIEGLANMKASRM